MIEVIVAALAFQRRNILSCNVFSTITVVVVVDFSLFLFQFQFLLLLLSTFLCLSIFVFESMLSAHWSRLVLVVVRWSS